MTGNLESHLDAIAKLGFVHERRPASDSLSGTTFVPGSDFDRPFPTVRVVADDDSTELHAFDGYVCTYSVRFDASTPANVINQAVAAALQN